MGMTPLALVGGTPHDTDRYSNWLERRLAEISPLLVDNPVWSDTLMTEVFGAPWEFLQPCTLRKHEVLGIEAIRADWAVAFEGAVNFVP